MKEKYIIFAIDGGMGKNIMATAVVSSISNKYPEHKIIVVAGWPRVWLNNPNVHRVYLTGNTPYFYDNYIRDKEVIILKQEPYHHQDYILNKKHLIEVWCEQCGVELNHAPELFYNWREEQFIKNQVGAKPYAVIQSNGGGDQSKYSWVRDIPRKQAQSIVDYMILKGLKVFHLRGKDDIILDNTVPFETDNIRDLWGLIKFSSKRVLIDSYAQHVAAAFNLKSTVCWPVDNSSALGYDFHDNVKASVRENVVHKMDSYLIDDQITGVMHECPFESPEVFNLQHIYSTL